MPGRGKLVALHGNHEIMMLKAREGGESLERWLGYGGDATLASYSPLDDAGRLADVPDAHWRFLEEETRPWFETETHFFVHANAFPKSRYRSSRVLCSTGSRSATGAARVGQDDGMRPHAAEVRRTTRRRSRRLHRHRRL